MSSTHFSTKGRILVIILLLSECNISMNGFPVVDASNDLSGHTIKVGVDSTTVVTTSGFITEASSLIYSPSTTPSLVTTLQWNKNNMTAREYQISYCSRLCLGNTVIYFKWTTECPAIECFSCDCNKPLCELYGTCCPDYDPSLPINISSFTNIHGPIEKLNATCADDVTHTPTFVQNASHNLNVKYICELVNETSYLLIRSCPANYSTDSRERTRCEEDIPATDQDFETYFPVTDMDTGHSFYNQFCAICNGVSNFTSWTKSMSCTSYMKVYQAKTPEEFLKLSLEPGSNCLAFKIPPSNISPLTCLKSWFGFVISSCNMTGEWDVYDEDVLRACGEKSGIANRTRYRNVVYKNIFCAECNMKSYSNTIDVCRGCLSPVFGIGDIILPFSFLLNLNSDSYGDTDRCPDNNVWAGPEKTCLPLHCSPGKTLNNGTCSTVNQQVKELFYQVHVLYLPDSSMTPLYSQFDLNTANLIFIQFLELTHNFILDVSNNFEMHLSMLYSNITRNVSSERYEGSTCLLAAPESFNFQLTLISLKVELEAPEERRDDFEDVFVNSLLTNSTSLTTNTNYSLTLKPILKPARLNSQFDCSTNRENAVSCLSQTLVKSQYTLYGFNKNEFLVVEPQLNCPFISLNSSDYFYKNDSLYNSSITLYLSNEPITIYELDDLNLMSIAGDGTLKICQELWENKIKSYLSSSYIEATLLVLLLVLTWVCLLLSICCLVLTVMTYFLFPVLRSVAGMNNIFLSLSLLLAQSFLLAASHVKQTGYLCTFLAISTHFLWLSMFCWCFTTCFHMFRVFTAQTRTTHATATSERLNLVKNVVGCSVIPSLIIIGVIVTNYFTTEGRLIGYGHDKCFLDSTPLVAITLATPLSFILLCNIFFFSVTVIKIHNVRKLQTQDFKQDDRANLYIYIKLSSMTGMFWILNIIAEATDNDPLRFIAIFLNGLQGVFIFLSYICNRRVFKLYARSLGFERLVPTTSTSDGSTMAKINLKQNKQFARSE